jgi:acetyl-CoA carboxylase biotin carboxyl carrier protein
MAKAPAAGKQKSSTLKAKAAKKPAKPAFPIDTDLVRVIANLLTETNVGEIEVKKGDLKVRVSRPRADKPSAAADAAGHPGAVKSPMVGTAYRKPNPEAKNFVDVGSSVKAGDKLMLIEAMKTFNDIVAPRAGTVSAILIDDGQPVEFGQTLFVIE